MHHKLKPLKLSCVKILEFEKDKTCFKSLSKVQKDKFRITGMKSKVIQLYGQGFSEKDIGT